MKRQIMKIQGKAKRLHGAKGRRNVESVQSDKIEDVCLNKSIHDDTNTETCSKTETVCI